MEGGGLETRGKLGFVSLLGVFEGSFFFFSGVAGFCDVLERLMATAVRFAPKLPFRFFLLLFDTL